MLEINGWPSLVSRSSGLRPTRMDLVHANKRKLVAKESMDCRQNQSKIAGGTFH